MKTRMLRMWAVGTLLAAIPLAGGCVQEAANSATTPGTNAPVVVTNRTLLAEPSTPVAEEPAPPVTIPPPLAEPGTNRPVVPDPAAAESKPLPPGLSVSPSLGEVVRMANGGVEPDVMLSFITNSAGTFNLGSDQIIYLKDIGLPAEVVTTMIQHDQAIATGQFQVTASTVPAPAAAGAPQPGGAPADTTSVWQAGQATNANPYAPAYAGQPPPQQPAPAPAASEAVQTAPQPQQPVSTTYFQENLAPYGNWVNVDGYGQCWQPTVTVINTAWRPYCDGGRWLYTDCGWYWQSDYAWGGVAFHYGRWFYAPRFGWCWWPNTVWGPSWVTWRSSSAYCGWAPMPPYSYCNVGGGFTYYGNNFGLSFGFGLGPSCYTFVPWGGFCHSRPWTCAVPPRHSAPIYQNTTVINNVIIGHNNTIINKGVDVTHVTKLTGRDVPRGTVREAAPAQRGIRPDHVERQGSGYVVYRPATLPAHTPTTASVTGNGNAFRPAAAPVSGARPATRPTGVTTRPATTPTVATESPRAVASRPALVPVTRTQPVSPALTTTRTTQPVSRPGTSASTTALTPVAGTSRTETVARPAVVSPRTGTANTPTAPTAPGWTRNPTPAARAGAPTALPYAPPTQTYSRPTAPAPSTPTPVTRPSYNYTAPQPAPAARPSYSPAPSYSPPARTYTAPTPAARPTYSAPAAPTYSAPAAPSRPAPAVSSRSTTSSTGSSRNGNDR